MATLSSLQRWHAELADVIKSTSNNATHTDRFGIELMIDERRLMATIEKLDERLWAIAMVLQSTGVTDNFVGND